MTEDEESDLIWDSLTEPTQIPFIERMHELSGLVHYTNFTALEGMICNEEIWFSQVMAMNDFDEIIKGKRLLEEMSMEGQPLEAVISSILKIDEELGQMFNATYRANKNDDLFNTFVSCWSACELGQGIHDNLTMWRGYASNGNGAAIVIDPIALGLDKLYASQIVAYPVFYETDEQFAVRANKTLQHFLKNFAKLDRNLINRHSGYAADAFAEICFHLAITHKHPGFHMEKEWRFVWRRHRDTTGQRVEYVKAKVGPRGLYEYFCLPIKSDPELTTSELKIQNLIREVMIGPTDDAYLKKLAVLSLLKANGFNLEKTKVTISEIPFRTNA